MPIIPKQQKKKWIPTKVAFERSGTTFDYNSSAWRKDRKAHLSLNPLCEICLSKEVYTAATVSDHKDPINQGGDPWAWSNRQALCSTCHNQKSGREAHSRFDK